MPPNFFVPMQAVLPPFSRLRPSRNSALSAQWLLYM